MIDLGRRGGRPLVIGHRGAAAVAPENTLAAFAAAVEMGVDLVELDVLALDAGTLVVAHSDRLEEITHGAGHGRVGSRDLAELRELAPALPTFDEALAWFAAHAPRVGLQIDLKLRHRLADVVAALEAHDLAGRTLVSSPFAPDLVEIGRVSPRLRLGLTYPLDRHEVSRRQALQPVVRAGLACLSAALPRRVARLARRPGVTALLLQHRLVTRPAVDRAHAAGVHVLAWTVDEPADVERVVAAGVDGVTTNDPASLLATLAA